ncbi:MAG: NUDIX domain-containing protein [Sedimentisphaerales bacterium]|nr:NUDIX domain-containing protein [Sedimentisphaerales bacterium]
MATRRSAGLLMYHQRAGHMEVFLIHPGGPFWSTRDDGAWSIPKGEFAAEEDPLDAAKREFREETGFTVSGHFTALEPIRQAGGKIVHAWVVEGDCNAAVVRSNTFSIEWPPHSGQCKTFPEVDRAGWFTLEQAQKKIVKSQQPLLDQFRRLQVDPAT